ncbi:MAG: IMP cyclohydrolase [Candidatus Paceibacterota bacterium]|jgi:phosphoribosylaminoimidazolecarboxamide formyltransferase/IMP cyclohydrolase
MKGRKLAMISVSDRTGLAHFVKGLSGAEFDIVSTRGTAKFLRDKGVRVIDVEKFTGVPPLVGLRGIKMIHTKVFTGVLADKSNPEHLADLKSIGIRPFDMVVCNFYPFHKSVKSKKLSHVEKIDFIDIGGPALVRCGAKNYRNVTVVTSPKDYGMVWKEIKECGNTTYKTRKDLALKAFEYTRWHDSLIIEYLKHAKD